MHVFLLFHSSIPVHVFTAAPSHSLILPAYKQLYATVDSYVCRAEHLEALVCEHTKQERKQRERASNIQLLESGGQCARQVATFENYVVIPRAVCKTGFEVFLRMQC